MALENFLGGRKGYRVKSYTRGTLDTSTTGVKLNQTMAANEVAQISFDGSGNTSECEVTIGGRVVASGIVNSLFNFGSNSYTALVPTLLSGKGENITYNTTIDPSGTVEYTLTIFEEDV